ncbi:hypothetical protein ABID59_000146 [Bradyrhizobium sp. S3.3.6]
MTYGAAIEPAIKNCQHGLETTTEISPIEIESLPVVV